MALRWGAGLSPGFSAFVVTAAALAVSAPLAFATPGRTPPAESAAAGRRAFKTEVAEFAIPAGSLNEALQSWAAATKLKIFVSTDLVAGYRTEGLAGPYTPETALKKLIAGTPLKFDLAGPRTVALYDPASSMGARAQSTTTLPHINVRSGQRKKPARAATAPARPSAPPPEPPETAIGPVRGYVATRSASGTKTDTPVISTPQSISVVARDQIQGQQARTVSQALNYTSGVIGETRGSVNGLFEFPLIRGFSSTNFIYQDGLQLLGASAGLQIEPFALERIEVVKGPASVLYGQGPPSGIVNLVSKRPTATPINEVQFQLGSFNRKQVNFDKGGALDKDGKVLYRVTGIARDSDTQVDFTRDDRFFIAPTVTFRPNLDTTLTILAQHQKADSGFFNFLDARGTFRPNPNGMLSTSLYTGDPNFNRSSITHTAVGYQFEHRVNDIVTFRQNYRHMDLVVHQDLVFSGSGFLTDPTNQRTVSRSAFRNHDDWTADTLDTHLQFNFNTGIVSHTALVGVDWQRSTQDHATGTTAAPSLNVFNPVYGLNIPIVPYSLESYQVARQTGFYMQDQLKLDRWVLLLGVRRDDASSTTTPNLNATTVTRQSDEATTKRAGLLYQFDNGVSPYVSYAESFTPQAGTDSGGSPFKPTTGRQYEAGVKYQPTWFNALFTFAAFDLARQNVPTRDPAHPTFNVQIGEVTSRGIEAEAKVSLSRSLDVVAAYTYLDTLVTKSNGTDLGKHPVAVPYNSAALWADYTFRSGPLSGFGMAAGVRFVGPTWGDAVNTVEVPSYTLVDAAIHYELADLDPRLKGVKLAVNATNLFDQVYVSSCLNALPQCFYGLRRNVVGTLSYRW